VVEEKKGDKLAAEVVGIEPKPEEGASTYFDAVRSALFSVIANLW
jgi:hypothetical protein